MERPASTEFKRLVHKDNALTSSEYALVADYLTKKIEYWHYRRRWLGKIIKYRKEVEALLWIKYCRSMAQTKTMKLIERAARIKSMLGVA